MTMFIAEHLLEILFTLLSAGALAFCRYMHKKMKGYKEIIDSHEKKQMEQSIDERIKPILEEIEELRRYIREVKDIEVHHLGLIISSYKYRLVQLCKEYLHQGFMTEAQYDQLSEFYKLYTALGGNGQAKDYYEKTMALDIEEPTENDK